MPTDDERNDRTEARISAAEREIAVHKTRLDIIELALSRMGETVIANAKADQQRFERAHDQLAELVSGGRVRYESLVEKIHALQGASTSAAVVADHEKRLRKIETAYWAGLGFVALAVPLLSRLLDHVWPR